MRLVKSRLLFIPIVIISVLLAACSPQPTSPGVPTVTSFVPSSGTNVPALSTDEVQPSPTPTPLPQESDTDKVVRSYHTVLMLERAADLILAYIVKIDSGELALGDPTPRNPYTNAFPVAIDVYNQTDPPPGLLNQYWEKVSSVTEQYSFVYTAIIQGKAISNRDLINLRAYRQMMTNYQNTAEGWLAQKGKGADFFSSQHKEVEQHFIKAYGDQPMPTLLAPGGK